MKRELDDSELCDDILRGGERAEDAFRMLYRRYSPRVYSYCRRMLPKSGRHFPDDVLQQTFIGLFNALKDGAEISNIGAYAMTSARNLCFNELARTRVPDSDIIDDSFASAAPISYENAELLQITMDAIDRLPEDYKELVLLREQMGFSYDEISAITGLSAAAARQRTCRARTMLRNMLAPYINDIENQSRGGE